MARIVKEHEQRRAELLQTAQKLFYANDYENTSVADIIDSVGIAKGTFYHYFKTKDELLNELIENLADAIAHQLEQIVTAPSMNAIEKLNTFFINAGNYKKENKEMVIMAAVAMYRTENIVLKEKMIHSFFRRSAPMISSIINQGISEGVFHTEYGDLVAYTILYMGLFMRDEFAEMLTQGEKDDAAVERTVRICMMYQDTIERVLNAPKGSIRIIERETVEYFFNTDFRRALTAI
jgi:AcrR family transcriptional regulator